MCYQLRRTRALVMVMCLLALTAVGCAGGSKGMDGNGGMAASTTPSASEQEEVSTQVVIDNFTFSPAQLTVSVGTKVTWVNRDDVPHTAASTAKPKRFDSRTLDTDEKFSHVFTEPGTYDYFCAVHPKMTGQVVVK